MKRFWKVWAESLGPKVGTNREADTVAAIRTFWWIIHIITCFMIIIHNGDRLGWWNVSIDKKEIISE